MSGTQPEPGVLLFHRFAEVFSPLETEVFVVLWLDAVGHHIVPIAKQISTDLFLLLVRNRVAIWVFKEYAEDRRIEIFDV